MSVIKLLEQLRVAGFITAYSHKNFFYLQINNFKKHQNPHVNEGASTIPAPEDSGSTPADSLLLIPDSLLPHPVVPVLSVPPQLRATKSRPVDNSTGKSKPSPNGKWWDTEEATLAEATARGLQTRPGESWVDLRQRIRATPQPKFTDS